MNSEQERRQRARLVERVLSGEMVPLSSMSGRQSPFSPLQSFTIYNRVYKKQELNLDGYTFKNCAFVECSLRTAKGNFHLNECYFNGCIIYFYGSALRAVRLSSILLDNWNHLPEEMRAVVGMDGSVTIP